MRTRVSAKGQTVIPGAIRKALGIGPRTVLFWQLQDGVIVVYPISAEPERAALGLLKGKGLSFREFIRERREERAQELTKELAKEGGEG